MHINRRSLHASAGVALIEVMFATGIMALTLSMIFGSIISLSDLGSISDNRRIASSRLAGVLEQLRTLSYDEALAFMPPSSSALETVVVECVDAKGEPIRLPVAGQSLAEPLPRPLEVRARVTRLDAKGHSHVVSGSILITR